MTQQIYPFLFGKVVFPSLDFLNRTSVSKKAQFLARSQWFPEERLREMQLAKLEEVLDWAGRESSFYQRFWRSAPSSRQASSQYQALEGLPVVTKADLREAITEFPVPGFRGRVHKIKTSGSTGHPMTFFRSSEQESWFWALRMRMWEWAGYVPGQPYLTLNLNPRTAWKKKLQDVIFRCSYHGFNANENDVDAVLNDLSRKKIRHLVGYASSLYLLAEAMSREGVPKPGVTTLLSTGDTLFPSYRRKIEDVFQTGVVDYYGAGGEGLHLASQCEQRGAYHIHVENAVVEFLRDGQPAASGETAEVVVTQLDNRAMPLIRYATGDVATLPESEVEVCPCGRHLPLLRGVEGRIPDIVLAPNGSALVVHFFTILFEYLEGIEQFQILQDAEDEITARIVPGPTYSREPIEAEIRRAIDRVTGGTLEVRFEYPKEIPPSESGKPRLVVSKLLAAPIAVDGRFSGEVINAIPS